MTRRRSRAVYAGARRRVSIVHAGSGHKAQARHPPPESPIVLDVIFLAAAAALFALAAAYAAACDRL